MQNSQSPLTGAGNSDDDAGSAWSIAPVKTPAPHTEQFTTALAHELRNPLTTVNLAVDMLKSMIHDKEHCLYLEIILRASARINDLVTNLLTLPIADDIVFEEHQADEVLDEALLLTLDRIKLKEITVRKDYAAGKSTILINRAMVKIALINIILNAIDAMPRLTGILNLYTRIDGGKFIIEIADNGKGISKSNLPMIFKPYYTNKTGGMGLGLSTTLEILRTNNASVDVQSEPGAGTQFFITFGQ